MNLDPYYLTARQAALALDVSRNTLYAYTSRGQLRSERVPGDPRERRYCREDIDRLRERKEARRNPARALAKGLSWGSPVLDSSITLIQNGRLYYRGQDAVKLAATATLEDVAELIWMAGPDERLFAQPLSRPRPLGKDPLTQMQTALPVAGLADASAYDLRPPAVRKTGARILRLLATVAASRASTAPVHELLRSGWGASAAAGEAIRSALVLCADHELNVSAFTARCAASAAASPYDVVSAALATLRGRRHGGLTERVRSLFDEVEEPRRAHAALAGRLRRGEAIPGFGHRLYPGGDPRAAFLLRGAELPLSRSLRKAAWDLLHEHPTIDFALVAIARAHRLPAFAPLVLFALGRTVGWIGHAIEEYANERLIRPRARYTGPAPQD